MYRFWRYTLYAAFLGLLYVYARSEGERFPAFLFIACLTFFSFNLILFLGTAFFTRIEFSVPQPVCEADALLSFNLKGRAGFPAGSTLNVNITTPKQWPSSGDCRLQIPLHQAETTFSSHLRTGQRGMYTLGPITAYLNDPLNLFQKKAVIGEKTTIFVTPHLLSSFHLSNLKNGLNFDSDILHQSGSPCSSARHYQAGDPFQRIHWKATAKQNKLMIRETEAEQTLPTLVWLDLSRQSFRNSQESLETAISLTATLLKELNEEAHSLHFFGTGRKWGRHHLPAREFTEVLKYLAIAQADNPLPPEEVILRLPEASHMYVITGEVTPALLGTLNKTFPYSPITIFSTASSLREEVSEPTPFIEVRRVANA